MSLFGLTTTLVINKEEENRAVHINYLTSRGLTISTRGGSQEFDYKIPTHMRATARDVIGAIATIARPGSEITVHLPFNQGSVSYMVLDQMEGFQWRNYTRLRYISPEAKRRAAEFLASFP